MWRHVVAGISIMTRFPFIYQTGFERGSKKYIFFLPRFWMRMFGLCGRFGRARMLVYAPESVCAVVLPWMHKPEKV